jgi:hypothetical protein
MQTFYLPIMHCEIIAVTDMSFLQSAVTEFLVKEGKSAGVIYELLPETKRQSMEWYHTTSPKKKKLNAVPSG